MRISDWSSDVCSSDLDSVRAFLAVLPAPVDYGAIDDMPVDIVVLLLSPRDAGTDHLKALARVSRALRDREFLAKLRGAGSPDAIYALISTYQARSEEHTYELQSLMRISYTVFCLKIKNTLI